VFDWSTAASLATASGTLVLAIATFASVRSAGRSARVAERALQVGLRPVLAASRLEDPPQKIMFVDRHFVVIEGGRGVAEAGDDAVYLAMGVRNVGSGLAVLHGWSFAVQYQLSDVPHTPPADFRRLIRDLYVPTGDIGFWQGAFRDPTEPQYTEARQAILDREPITIELLYGDHEGGQRAISRFSLTPMGESGWLAAVSRHWNLDRPDPR
jgi:hypothetical protein